MADFAFRPGKALTGGVFEPASTGRRALTRYAIAPAAVGLVFAARALFAPMLDHEATLLFFVPAVLAASGRGGVGPGLLATGLGLVLGFFFVESPGLLTPSEVVSDIAFAAIGCGTAWYGGQLIRAR